MRTFENIYLDVMELEGKPATVYTIIDALYKPDTGIHEEVPQDEEGGVYICDCGICQNLAPALLQIGKEIATLREKLDRCNAHLSSCQDIGNQAGMVNEELEAERAALRQENEELLDQAKQLASDNHAVEAELTALREVARAADHSDIYPCGDYNVEAWTALLMSLETARAAGYLAQEEARP